MKKKKSFDPFLSFMPAVHAFNTNENERNLFRTLAARITFIGYKI